MEIGSELLTRVFILPVQITSFNRGESISHESGLLWNHVNPLPCFSSLGRGPSSFRRESVRKPPCPMHTEDAANSVGYVRFSLVAGGQMIGGCRNKLFYGTKKS